MWDTKNVEHIATEQLLFGFTLILDCTDGGIEGSLIRKVVVADRVQIFIQLIN